MTILKMHEQEILDVDSVGGGNVYEIGCFSSGTGAWALMKNPNFILKRDESTGIFEVFDTLPLGGDFFGLWVDVGYGFGYAQTVVFAGTTNIYYINVDLVSPIVESLAVPVGVTVLATTTWSSDGGTEFGFVGYDSNDNLMKFYQVAFSGSPEIWEVFSFPSEYQSASKIGFNQGVFLIHDSVANNYRRCVVTFYQGYSIDTTIYPTGYEFVQQFKHTDTVTGQTFILTMASDGTLFVVPPSEVLQTYTGLQSGSDYVGLIASTAFQTVDYCVNHVNQGGTVYESQLNEIEFTFNESTLDLESHTLSNPMLIGEFDSSVSQQGVSCIANYIPDE